MLSSSQATSEQTLRCSELISSAATVLQSVHMFPDAEQTNMFFNFCNVKLPVWNDPKPHVPVREVITYEPCLMSGVEPVLTFKGVECFFKLMDLSALFKSVCECSEETVWMWQSVRMKTAESAVF